MKEFLDNSIFFGLLVSILSYQFGVYLKKKSKLAICNPLLISIMAVILLLLIFHVDYATYHASAKYLTYLLTPATVCLAIPLYEQLELLKNNRKAIVAGLLSGVLTNFFCIVLLSMLFRLNHQEYVTLLPKSITTAIGIGVSEELGGIVSITATAIIITGVLGNVIAEVVCKVFHIKEPIAKGIALGSAAHAIGTVKAMEMGEVEGAMSSLSIVITGLLTVIGASIFAGLIS